MNSDYLHDCWKQFQKKEFQLFLPLLMPVILLHYLFCLNHLLYFLCQQDQFLKKAFQSFLRLLMMIFPLALLFLQKTCHCFLQQKKERQLYLHSLKLLILPRLFFLLKYFLLDYRFATTDIRSRLDCLKIMLFVLPALEKRDCCFFYDDTKAKSALRNLPENPVHFFQELQDRYQSLNKITLRNLWM